MQSERRSPLPIVVAPLAFYIGHGCTEINVQHIALWGNQCRNGFYTRRFRFLDPSTVIAQVYYFHLFRPDKVDDVLLCTYTNRASRMIKN